MNLRIAAPLAIIGLALSSAACAVYAEPVTVAYVDSTEGPAEVDLRASTPSKYEGRNVYYFHAHWYYREGARWAYYQQEPAELHRQSAPIPDVLPAP